MLQPIRTWPRRAPVTMASVLLLGAVSLVACERPAEPAPAPKAPVAAVAPPPAVAAPLSPPLVVRTELLAAITAARAAYAAGQPDASAALTGRRFTLRQAFGCTGAAEFGAPSEALFIAGAARLAWGRDHKTLEISLAPADWTTAPVLAGETAWEAAEGYWLTRPWLQTEGCPAAAALSASPPHPEAASAPVLSTNPTRFESGLAAVFAKEGSRVSRRDGKPFSFSLRGEAPLAPHAGGYRLVIEGRFTSFSDGRTIRCTSSSPDLAPVCIAAAEVDRVAFEDADGKLLKEWRQG